MLGGWNEIMCWILKRTYITGVEERLDKYV